MTIPAISLFIHQKKSTHLLSILVICPKLSESFRFCLFTRSALRYHIKGGADGLIHAFVRTEEIAYAFLTNSDDPDHRPF